MIRTVGSTVAQRGNRDATIRADAAMHVGRAESAAGWSAADGATHLQLFVGFIAAVVVAVASPSQRNAVLRLHALKLRGGAGGGGTLGGFVLVRAVVTIRLAIAFPRHGDTLHVTVGFVGRATEEIIRAFRRRLRRRRRRPVGIVFAVVIVG